MINVQQMSDNGAAEESGSSLIMPEYGRNVQHMVEHALTIENKEERTRCVNAIMQTMGNLFPYLRNEESRHKMYDHLAIMSDFRLDIDSPYSKPERENMKYRPETLPYNTQHPIRFRHYGRVLEAMIAEAMLEQDENCRQQLILRIASRMRQNYLVWNKDHVDAEHIKEDIQLLSGGILSCDFEEFTTLFSRPIYVSSVQRQNTSYYSNNTNNAKWKKMKKR
ncbi:MAG: DUF4290 domain-containing protein [Paludibacter sp.]|nr:DUF4290 domain-containing protein [Bacteroidales bacterium]MCM1068320.1 DUF4290 domain-containing protein [Prevotella sp.]MCM1354053.1 DUF4290 domain-containing protein [Bacteroides sp.]MCM1442105.1 DUF4290 domain-containing protein [Muribaculum sp.]MCM1482001.1 DUF4290 domain-containing protein [Paludibacter sp.]